MSICDVIEHFQISREDLEKLYFETSGIYYRYIWDFDLLYGNDEPAVDQFYRNVDELREIAAKRSALRHLKEDIFLDHESKWEETFGAVSPATPQISIVEVARGLNISRNELERYAEASADTTYHTYDNNYDLIYGQSAGIQSISQDEDDPYPALARDAAFCGIDDYRLE